MRYLIVTLVLAGLVVLAGCGTAPVITTPQQFVPQIYSSPSGPSTSYCLGTGLRVFQVLASHGDGSTSVVNVLNLPPSSPWRCP